MCVLYREKEIERERENKRRTNRTTKQPSAPHPVFTRHKEESQTVFTKWNLTSCELKQYNAVAIHITCHHMICCIVKIRRREETEKLCHDDAVQQQGGSGNDNHICLSAACSASFLFVFISRFPPPFLLKTAYFLPLRRQACGKLQGTSSGTCPSHYGTLRLPSAPSQSHKFCKQCR